MGQIVSTAAKPKRCNKNQLSQLGVLAAGLHVLVSSDNSMNAAGQGNFDCYIVGDGTTAATALPLQKIESVNADNLKIEKQPSELPDLAFADENGNILVEFENGHVKTKNFNSDDIHVDSAPEISDEEFIDFGILDERKNAILVIEKGNLRTKNFDSRDVDSDGGNYNFDYTGEKIEVGKSHKMSCNLLFSTTHSVTRSIQGCACYGGFLFVAQDYMYSIAVYDVESQSLVNDITFEGNNAYHCNNISFGKWKYASDDFSPCLYVSMENASQHKCLVFQVTRTNGVFGLTLVQEITYPAPSAGVNPYYPNCFIDPQNGKIYVIGYSTNSYQQSDSTSLIIQEYELPLPSAGDTTLANPNSTSKIPSEYATQGGFISYGKLYQVYGIPSGSIEQTFLKVHEVGTWNLLNSISLLTIGISEEPEAVCENEDYLLIVTVNGKVYKLKFK
jgi:hypothetical protein